MVIEELKERAEQGDTIAQAILGRIYGLDSKALQSSIEAFKYLYKLAEQGNAEAQYNLGVMYVEGQGVNQDDREAVKWFCKAAEQGNAEAQQALNLLEVKPKRSKSPLFWIIACIIAVGLFLLTME